MDEVEKVARAIAEASHDYSYERTGKIPSQAIISAQAAIAALDEARGDPVAKVVAWLRNGGDTDISKISGSAQMLFLEGMNRYADAIERGEYLK